MKTISLENENAFCKDDLVWDVIHSKNELEIEVLKKFDEECSKIFGEEWESGALTLINEKDWMEYASDLFDEAYITNKADSILLSYIDYERFAEDLKIDYYSIKLNNTYFYGLYQ